MVTIENVMGLPCMRGSHIIAGRTALNKAVRSVSVLEYAQPKREDTFLFQDMEVQANELVLTAFMSIPEDVEAQCEIVRQINDNGVIGIILYYVGIFVPKVDSRLIELANELGFAIICMPENDLNLRYSDAIREITGAIFADGSVEQGFVSDMIRRVSQLPAEQRSMDIMLRMIGDSYGVSLALVDSENRIINYAGVPEVPLSKAQHIVEELRNHPDAFDNAEGFRCEWLDIQIRQSNALSLLILSEVGKEIKDTKPVKEAVEIFAGIWSEKHGISESAELLRAIFQDEPLLIFRLSTQMKIDLEALHGMLVVFPSRQEANLSRQIFNVMQQQFIHGQIVLGEVYDGAIILFVQRQLFRGQHSFMDAIAEAVHTIDSGAKLFGCYYLADLAAVRAAWSTLQNNYALTEQLYPEHKWFSLQEASFASECAKIISDGAASVQYHLNAVIPLNTEEDPLRKDLHKTLAVYLLDCGASVLKTSERMYLHKNTIKYRINRISELLGYRPDEMPEERQLYLAVALERLLDI